ncbi:DUF192 domain-containing protein [Myxococcaceae bacterium GXIMD 01537]
MRWPLLAGLGAALLAAGCQQSPEAQEKPAAMRSRPKDITAEDYEMAPLPRAWVRLPDAYGGVRRVEVEVAATPDSRTRGLMWRKELPAGKGMLFIFPQDEVQGFWMRNTLISLDMLFIDSRNQVVGIVERAEPRNLTTRGVGIPSQYVLEVPGGWCQSVGVTKGVKVEFEGLSGVSVIP